MAARGHQTSYRSELADEICERLAAGETLNAICRDDHMPAESSVRQWVMDDREGFAAKYARARDLQLEHFEDRILELGDGVLGASESATVQAAKLAADNRKWLMSRLRPNKYGERTTITGAEGKDLIPERASDPDRLMGAFLAILKTIPDGR